jgi:hypothetical protein
MAAKHHKLRARRLVFAFSSSASNSGMPEVASRAQEGQFGHDPDKCPPPSCSPLSRCSSAIALPALRAKREEAMQE